MRGHCAGAWRWHGFGQGARHSLGRHGRWRGAALYPQWHEGRYSALGEQRFWQHPADYVDAMTLAAHNALRALSPEECAGVCAIGVDATGSTVCPADRKGSPLALSESFEENPNAMFHLWKDHTAIKEAAKANTALSQWPDDDYARYQGSIHLSGSGPRRCAPPESILLLGALPGVG